MCGLRDPGHPRRPGARSGDRGRDDSHLPDLDLRAGGRRRQQGLRLRAGRQPHAYRSRGVPRLVGERRPRPRVLVGPRGDDVDHAPPRPRRPRRLRQRCLRRHVPHVLAGLRAEGLPVHLHDPRRALERPGGTRRRRETRLARDADEPAAQPRRHRGRRRRDTRRRRPARRRLDVRDAVPPEPARPRRGPRRPLDDEVPRRALRRRSGASPGRTTRRSPSGCGSCRSRSGRCPARSTRGSCSAA